MISSCIFLFILFSYQSIISAASERHVVTFLGQRSYVPKLYPHIQQWNHQSDDPCTVQTSISCEISKTFRPERITQCLFGDESLKCQQTIVISGKQTEQRSKNLIALKKHFYECKPCHAAIHLQERFSVDWLASYFGLPHDFKSFVHFEPRIHEYTFVPHIHITANSLLNGLYATVYAPFTHSRWDLHMDETVEQPGELPYPAGFISPETIGRKNLVGNFRSFISGECTPHTDQMLFHPLQFSKMSCRGDATTKLTELLATVGWNVRETDRSLFGTALLVSAPTGTRPKADFLFAPIAGNGHHWYTGFKLYGALRTPVESGAGSCSIYGDVGVSHLFASTQQRTFDAKRKPNSRYMLLQKITPPVENNLQGNNIPVDKQFKKELMPLANISTFDVDVHNGAQFTINAYVAYTRDHTSWNFGYRYWTRSCDELCIRNPHTFPSGQWAFIGDAHLYGFIAQDGDFAVGQPVALSATQHAATIKTGKNFPAHGSTDQQTITNATRNANIDNPQPATAGSSQRLVAFTSDLSQVNQIKTSVQSQTIHISDLHKESARTTGTTHTIFSSVQKTWECDTTMAITFSCGADIDFGRNSEPTPALEVDDCINCAFSTWKVYGTFSCSFY